MNAETTVFFLVAAAAIVSAILVITRRNPISCVLFLIVNFFCLAVLYLTLHAQFIAIIQIIVYAGAIMVLFLFVIMLLNLGDESRLTEKRSYRRVIGALLAVAVLVELFVGLGIPMAPGPQAPHPSAVRMGTVEAIGNTLYTSYLFPFEVTSALLLAALVGVIVLGKKKFQ